MPRAATAEVSSPPASIPSLTGHMTDEERAEYAHSIGYRQIGKDLPRGVTLQQVISTMPKEVCRADAHFARSLWGGSEQLHCRETHDRGPQ